MDIQDIRETARRHPVLDRLPKRSLAIVDELVAARENAAITTRGVLDQRQEIRGQVAEARRILDGYEELQRTGGLIRETPLPPSASGARGFTRAPDEGRLKQARQDLVNLEERLARLEQLAADHAARREVLDELLQRLGQWLDSVPADAAITEWKPKAAPTLPRGRSHLEAVHALRGQIDHLAADRREIQASPLPSSECKTVARAQIAAMAARGAPSVFALIEGGGSVAWPEVDMKGIASVAGESGAASGYATVRGVDALAVLCWAHADTLVAAIEMEIDQSADDKNALTPQERQARLTAIDAEILSVERSECSFIEAAGDAAMHRPDTDPRALLRLADDLPPPMEH